MSADPNDYCETLGSPVITGEKVERIYHAKHGTGITLFNDYTDGTSYTDGYFDADQSSVTGGVYDTVRLVFTKTLDGEIPAGSSTRTVYDADCTPTARDIRFHPDFKAKWKYNLYQFCKKGEQFYPTLPGWWDTATDTVLTSPAADTYAWGEVPPSSSNGSWYIVAQRTKPTDTYPYPAPTVTETKYCGSKATAEGLLQTVGTCKKPGKTFGYNSAKEYWQVTSCSTHKERRKWVVTIQYQYAPNKWDGDIIEGGATGGEIE